MVDILRLQKAIRDLHGLESTHLCSKRVHEMSRGATVWKGVVEVFAVYGHARTETAFAWSDVNPDGRSYDVAVLRLPPIDSPLDAIRALRAGARGLDPAVVHAVDAAGGRLGAIHPDHAMPRAIPVRAGIRTSRY